MQSSKTFRLFVSSTFSDFSVEREVLQGEVFAEVKEYCKERGYIFLPIDLRWGVNEEAQVDQKTLELCLREVQACKSYPYPNFLLMLGDRYGWVPLPYSVESKEFREILSKVPQNDQEYFLEWYQEDLNQIPASYILKERYGEFVKHEKWEKEESRLRDILQSAVVQTNISEQERRKYFLSATEAEIQEGIIPYITPTKFQQKLLKEKSYLKDMDTENIFGFFRTIEPSSKKSDHFIAQDNQEAKSLKQRVKDTLIQENILEVTTSQTDENSLDTNCIEEFKQRVTSFLKAKVNEQIAKERSIEPISIEIQSQEYFAKQKRANFVGQEDGLARIREYIDSQEKTPLVIYGKSGSGKSALMAKAIQEAKKDSAKVVYRFIGATPNSTSTKEMLISIFEELGIQLQEQKSQNLQDSESFEDFSYRVYNEIIKLKDNIVIFIDAIDQLQNEDEFLWLPKTLPTNVKIILSALNDTNYKSDSKYFAKLKQKGLALYQMPPFDKPLQMLEKLLKADNRTLQPKQKDYFLQKYNRVNRPLYIFVASKELKHWRSFENLEDKKAHKFQSLANTQEGVIKEYIENLSTLYHHKKILVQRVLGYIYASRDGLSENEIIELLSIDKDFVKNVAPDTYHKNKSGDLPVVIWARLYTHLSDFLSKRVQDNEELYWFFHREFQDVISKTPNQKELHQQLIFHTQELITKNQHQDFDKTRWGKLHIALTTEYAIRYNKDLKEYAEFIGKLKNIGWIEGYVNLVNDTGVEHYEYNRLIDAMAYNTHFFYITKNLYKMERNKWTNDYTTALNNLALVYKKNNKTYKAISLLNESLLISKTFYNKNKKKWVESYIADLNNLASSYLDVEQTDKAMKLYKKGLKISRKLYSKKSYKWAKDYTRFLINLATIYSDIGQLDKVIKFIKEGLSIRKEFYTKNPKKWTRDYTIALNSLANYYKSIERIDEAIKLEEESLSILKEVYNKTPDLWIEDYVIALTNLATSYKSIERIDKAIKLEEESLSILKEAYNKNPDRWIENYSISLYNLAFSYSNIERIDEAIKLEEESFSILKEAYNKNPDRWIEDYIIIINNLAFSYTNIERIDKAIKLEEESLSILKKAYNKNPDRWLEEYTRVLNNLAFFYSKINQIELELELEKESLSILKKAYNKNPDRWAYNYSIILSNIAITYKSIKQVDRAIELEEESLSIIEKQYIKKPDKWISDYSTTLSNLAMSYLDIGKISKAYKMEQKNFSILKKLYEKKPDRWAEHYIMTLNNLASIYKNKGKGEKSIKIRKKSLSIVKKLYEKKPNRWIENYIMTLNNLVTTYRDEGYIEEAIKIGKKSLSIVRKLYKKNSNRWKWYYEGSLNNLAIFYLDVGNHNKSLKLFKKLKKILKKYPNKEIDINEVSENIIWLKKKVNNTEKR